MKFTDIKNLYYGCKLLAFAEESFSNVYDCNETFVNMRWHHALDLIEWLNGHTVFMSFQL